jgi:hypothetical protein
MAITQIWTGSRVPTADGREAVAGDGSPGRRAGRWLWTLLHAQGLINGTADSRDYAAFAEDDRRRMSARRTN